MIPSCRRSRRVVSTIPSCRVDDSVVYDTVVYDTVVTDDDTVVLTIPSSLKRFDDPVVSTITSMTLDNPVDDSRKPRRC